MKPISLHPENPRYFLFRGKPAVLISSAEHYGALLNLDFDYVPYLKELEARGLNQSRCFSGAYREVIGIFGIAQNTLAPKPERFCAPWPRTETPGAADGLGKFDLSRWNDAYFRRLKDYLREAGRRGVVIELVLFCQFYEENIWNVSPMNAKNNIAGVGDAGREEVYALKHPDLTAVQEALTRKLVEETAEFDNIYYEICNEPYLGGGVTLEWQARIAQVIMEAQKERPEKHLIAQNIANESAVIENPDPNVSIFNFHYANPPRAVTDNYGLNRPIAYDETGFKGTEDAVYRAHAWEFMLAGGSVFSHLDYSFTAGHEQGDFAYPQTQPGGGSAELRRQLKTLHDFLNGFAFVRMKPDTALIGGLPEGVTAYALAEAGKQVAVYLKGGPLPELTLKIPAGTWQAEWLHPATGQKEPPQRVAHGGGDLRLPVPAYTEELALRLARR